VVVITVLSQRNRDYIDELLERVSPYVDGFLFTFLYPYRQNHDTAISSSDIPAVKARLLSLKKSYIICNPTSHLRRTERRWNCHDWLTVSINHVGLQRDGCFVDHVEPRDCSMCELACYQGISAFHDFNLDAWFHLYRLILRVT
jgi:hypothetical protein